MAISLKILGALEHKFWRRQVPRHAMKHVGVGYSAYEA